MLTLDKERGKNSIIIGVDEVGRGPLAGPVVAAAVILHKDICLDGIDDSKKLSAIKRDDFFLKILSFSKFAIGFSTVEEIDRQNILQASLLAMRRAFDSIDIKNAAVLVDGQFSFDKENRNIKTCINGDQIYPSIAVASIVAKVVRDRYMCLLAKKFGEYGWDKNSGYGTAKHLLALEKHGVTPLHRKTFAPVHKILFKK